jgi:serine/threonine-protein kinase
MEDSAPKSGALRPVEPHGPTALPTEKPVTPPWLNLNRVLDERYRIDRLLGKGGMGDVFVAEHLALRKEVAIKVIRAELAGNGDVATRFAREAMATAQFEHPHVASAIDYGTLPEGGAYFVMQLVRGVSVRALLAQNGKLPWRRVCELLAQVADALSAAKAAGIVHRDLKPDNVLVEAREDGSDLVKVLDFGIARVAPRDAAPEGAHTSRELTRVGTVMGTPGYMAPEQAVGDRVDHRADLYALGVMLWECIAGRELWEAEDLTTVVARQMTESVPSLTIHGDPHVPEELDTLVQALTARLPNSRPDSASEVRDALRRIGAGPAREVPKDEPLDRARVWIAGQARSSRETLTALPKNQQRGLIAAASVLILMLGWAALPERTAKKIALTVSQDTILQSIAPPEMFAPPPPPDVPEELKGNLKALLEGKTLRERREAGQALLSYGAQDRIAEWVRTLAELEVATSCKIRRDVIERMRQKPDERFLPALRRRHEARRSGCGFLGFEDCQGCIRTDLKRAVEELDARFPDQKPVQPDADPHEAL